MKTINSFLLYEKLLDDNKLSLKAKGLLLYLISKDDEDKYNQNEIKKHCADGSKSISSAVKELIGNGYLEKHIKRDLGGKFEGYEYIIHFIKE